MNYDQPFSSNAWQPMRAVPVTKTVSSAHKTERKNDAQNYKK